MKYRYRVIADEDTVLGFQTAGIPGVAVEGAEDAAQAIRSAREAQVGIIVITEEVADMVREEVDNMRFRETLPMIVEIPGPQGPLSGRRTLPDIIREAVGIKV